MLIRFRKAKHEQDRHTLTCIRGDGSVIGMNSTEFFVLHDLGHFAIESELGFGYAFFGLLAAGWDLSSFEERAPDSRKARPLPLEAMQAEVLAGLLDLSRANPELGSEELLEVLASLDAAEGGKRPALTPDQLNRVRETHRLLLQRWQEVGPGEQLELEFPLGYGQQVS